MKLEIKRRKSKICEKIDDLFAYVGKLYYLCTRKLRILVHTNSGGAHPDKAIERGRSFLLVVSFYSFFNAIIWR